MGLMDICCCMSVSLRMCVYMVVHAHLRLSVALRGEAAMLVGRLALLGRKRRLCVHVCVHVCVCVCTQPMVYIWCTSEVV